MHISAAHKDYVKNVHTTGNNSVLFSDSDRLVGSLFWPKISSNMRFKFVRIVHKPTGKVTFHKENELEWDKISAINDGHKPRQTVKADLRPTPDCYEITTL